MSRTVLECPPPPPYINEKVALESVGNDTVYPLRGYPCFAFVGGRSQLEAELDHFSRVVSLFSTEGGLSYQVVFVGKAPMRQLHSAAIAGSEMYHT